MVPSLRGMGGRAESRGAESGEAGERIGNQATVWNVA